MTEGAIEPGTGPVFSYGGPYMDSDFIMILMSMIFSLLILLAIGGFVLLFPLARRLGALAEEWLRIRRGELDAGANQTILDEIRGLHGHIAALDARLDAVAERQEFMESLVESDERKHLLATPTNN